MFNNRPRIGQELLDVPMGEMIRQMAFAIAEAQTKLDANSIEVAQMMGGLRTITEDINGEEKITFEDSRVFFGMERMTVSQACAYLNSFKDTKLQETIYGNIMFSGDLINIPDNQNTNYTPKHGKDNDIILVPRRVSMLELGFTPTFYQFVDTIIEVKISIKYTQEGSMSRTVSQSQQSSASSTKFSFGLRGLGFGLNSARQSTVVTSQVNASFSQKYNYSAEGASLLRTKLVPVPPPAVLEEYIRRIIEVEFEKQPSSSPQTTS